MLRIAIVEDTRAASEQLAGYLFRCQAEHDEVFQIVQFSDGADFLSNYRADFDIVFMDIEMPNLDGMRAAARLRKMDSNVCLIFVTNMAQYAVKGYEVDAMDFLVKPVSYSVFAYKLKKAIAFLEKRRGQELVLKTKTGLVRVQISDIYYVEVLQHRVLYHTDKGVIETWGTLSQAEAQMVPLGFSRCNSAYLVNLRYVDRVEENFVYLKDTRLEISRGKKKQFVLELTQFLGG